MAHSELRAIVVKAARGAGLDWGLAEEAGWAAEWLARRGLPAGEWASLWLTDASSCGADPVRIGTAWVDRWADRQGPFPAQDVPDGMVAPGYLLPFLHRLTMRHGAIEIVAPTGRVAGVDPDGTVSFGPAWSERVIGGRVQLTAAGRPEGRSMVSADALARLTALALETTVPASDLSRRGAGGDTPDGD